MEKKKNILLYCLLAAALAGILSSVILGAFNAKAIHSLQDAAGISNEGTREDDVPIMNNEYRIVSTTQISDAYKAGSTAGLSKRDKETLEMASAVLDEIITEDMSDYEKEKAVYEWMTTELTQNRDVLQVIPQSNGNDSDNPYGVLKYHDAVCVGYATTFRLFMNMLGMDCHIVHNEYHSWDLVQLEGDWYHVDVYSYSHGVLYGNFNMTDEVAKNGHNWDESALPEAKSVKHTPAVRNGIEVEGILEVPAALKEAMDGRDGALFFKFQNPLSEQDMAMADFLVGSLEQVLGSMLEESYYFRAAWYPGEGDSYILGLLVESRSVEEEPEGIDAGSPEGRKIIQAIAAAFDIDPAALGGGAAEPPENFPVEGITADGKIITGGDPATQRDAIVP